EGIEKLSNPRLELLPAQAVQPAVVFDHLAGRHPVVDPSRRRKEADVPANFVGLGEHVKPGDVGLARGRFEEGAEDAEGGRLAGAVRPQEAEDLTGAGREGDAVHGRDRSPGRIVEGLAQADDVDHPVGERETGGEVAVPPSPAVASPSWYDRDQ